MLCAKSIDRLSLICNSAREGVVERYRNSMVAVMDVRCDVLISTEFEITVTARRYR